jgi:hypothetical protein
MSYTVKRKMGNSNASVDRNLRRSVCNINDLVSKQHILF